jgi:hypothetical protein
MNLTVKGTAFMRNKNVYSISTQVQPGCFVRSLMHRFGEDAFQTDNCSYPKPVKVMGVE